MRIRLPFAGVFFLLLLVVGYAGLTSLQLNTLINDKILHLVAFFLLTIVFYWIVDTNRRRTLNLTLTVCTLILGVGSEFVQSFLPNDREFDIYDIVANIVGSLGGLALCSWYHNRMLERRRHRRQYDVVPGEDIGDVELGEGQVSGVTMDGAVMDGPGEEASGPSKQTLEQQVDNWDENVMDDDWPENEDGDIGGKGGKGKAVDTGDIGDSKRT